MESIITDRIKNFVKKIKPIGANPGEQQEELMTILDKNPPLMIEWRRACYGQRATKHYSTVVVEISRSEIMLIMLITIQLKCEEGRWENSGPNDKVMICCLLIVYFGLRVVGVVSYCCNIIW